MSDRIVIDASIALAWALEDEEAERAEEALGVVERFGAFVPTLWTYEVANALTQAVRRSRIDAEKMKKIVTTFTALRIVAVPPDAPDWYVETSALAIEHGLTAYDASYLQLAHAAGAKLASADKKLQAVAEVIGVSF